MVWVVGGGSGQVRVKLDEWKCSGREVGGVSMSTGNTDTETKL